MKLLFVLAIISGGMKSECIKAQPLETVAWVDLNRYMGRWFEIASYPQRFQKGCVGTTAVYTLSDNEYVVVENQCKKGGFEGKLTSIRGKAFVVANTGNAKLLVQFFWPFKGKYWIIDLDDDYQYAVVSHPNLRYLWILSRTPSLEEDIYQQICHRLVKKGFDLAQLQRTPQEEY